MPETNNSPKRGPDNKKNVEPLLDPSARYREEKKEQEMRHIREVSDRAEQRAEKRDAKFASGNLEIETGEEKKLEVLRALGEVTGAFSVEVAGAENSTTMARMFLSRIGGSTENFRPKDYSAIRNASESALKKQPLGRAGSDSEVALRLQDSNSSGLFFSSGQKHLFSSEMTAEPQGLSERFLGSNKPKVLVENFEQTLISDPEEAVKQLIAAAEQGGPAFKRTASLLKARLDNINKRTK